MNIKLLIRNYDEFNRLATHIERNPEHYAQHTYGCETSCGTSHCIAGWVVAMNGYVPAYGADWRTVKKPRGKKIYNTSEVAGSILGLSLAEARTLFAASWKPKVNRTVPQQLRDYAANVCITNNLNSYSNHGEY